MNQIPQCSTKLGENKKKVPLDTPGKAAFTPLCCCGADSRKRSLLLVELMFVCVQVRVWGILFVLCGAILGTTFALRRRLRGLAPRVALMAATGVFCAVALAYCCQ